jgi:anaerobic selenocysteine-containing dehydrogenase
VAEEATASRVGRTSSPLAGRPSCASAGATTGSEQQGRLTEPMRRDAGATTTEPISWDEAFARIADGLRALDSPDEAVFYTSGRTSNEAAFLYQLFVRELRHQQPARLLEHVPRVERRRLTETIGVGKGTVTLETSTTPT